MDNDVRNTGSATEVADLTDVDDWDEATIDRSESAPIELGTVIRERFVLESVIGHGSTGIVYRALDRLHSEMEDRDPYVAIKVLRDEFKQHPNALKTLQREARKAQKLAHENIISVYSFEREGPLVFMTMELLDGRPLSTIIGENPNGIPADEAVPMIRGMAEALAYAHKNDIVHSDFTPANVYLTENHQIKVLDFGVARAARRESEARSEPTQTYFEGARGLTPAYASLQMLEGQDPDPADDVFALAIVAYELLTGTHPFGREPADRHAGARPKIDSLPGLTHVQKKALARAFSFGRESRHTDAVEFLAEFARSRKTRAFALVAVALIAALGAIAIAALREGPPRPDVAFSELPQQVQAEVEYQIEQGQEALALGDAGINAAYQHFVNAFELHRNNSDAIDGLERVADRYLSSVRTMDVGSQQDFFELMFCQEHLATYEPVVAVCPELLGTECAEIARRC